MTSSTMHVGKLHIKIMNQTFEWLMQAMHVRVENNINVEQYGANMSYTLERVNETE